MLDAHVHVDIYGQTVNELTKYLDDDRIDQSIVLSVLPVRGHVGVTKSMNWRVLAACTDYPDRLIPFFVLDPREGDIETRMKLLVDLGFKGFGEHKIPDEPFNSPGCDRIYSMCGELGLPVIFHIGREGFPESDMAGVEEMIKNHENVTFIAHSMGWWKQISKVWSTAEHAPIGEVVPGGNVDRMLNEYPNLFTEISTGEGIRALARDPNFTEGFLKRHQKRLIYGSDFPAELSGTTERFDNQIKFRKMLMFSKEHPVELPENYVRLLDMINASPELRKDFTHNNLARILGLPTI